MAEERSGNSPTRKNNSALSKRSGSKNNSTLSKRSGSQKNRSALRSDSSSKMGSASADKSSSAKGSPQKKASKSRTPGTPGTPGTPRTIKSSTSAKSSTKSVRPTVIRGNSRVNSNPDSSSRSQLEIVQNPAHQVLNGNVMDQQDETNYPTQGLIDIETENSNSQLRQKAKNAAGAQVSNQANKDSEFSRETRNKEISKDKGSKIRLGAIALIVSSLVFAIGVQVGTRNSEALLENAVETILKTGANELDRKVLERAAIEGMLKATGDEWANYFPNSALQVLQEQSSNMFTGIGVWLAKSRGGQVRISSIQEGSPASKSGLLVGDQILEVNGTDVRGASLTSVIALIRGDLGKRLELLVLREDRKVLATVSAKKVELQTVEARQVSEKIALLEISSFSSGTAQEVRDSLADLSYDSGVILDLRNNPGGLIEEAVKVAELFIGKGVVVSYQVNDSERLFRVTNPKPINAPLIVMINRNTASSAEILAGAFQDRNRGVVIGERSYGKGSVQEFITLGDGSKIELTVALYRTPSGRVIDEVGIIPDLEVPNSEIGEKALQVLGGLSTLTSSR